VGYELMAGRPHPHPHCDVCGRPHPTDGRRGFVFYGALQWRAWSCPTQTSGLGRYHLFLCLDCRLGDDKRGHDIRAFANRLAVAISAAGDI
jgi:hypothetical protein